MTEKEKLEDHKGSGTHWQQKNPQIHFKFALNGADCSLSFLTQKCNMWRLSLGIQRS